MFALEEKIALKVHTNLTPMSAEAIPEEAQSLIRSAISYSVFSLRSLGFIETIFATASLRHGRMYDTDPFARLVSFDSL